MHILSFVGASDERGYGNPHGSRGMGTAGMGAGASDFHVFGLVLTGNPPGLRVRVYAGVGAGACQFGCGLPTFITSRGWDSVVASWGVGEADDVVWTCGVFCSPLPYL
jgi:hypothetical protein